MSQFGVTKLIVAFFLLGGLLWAVLPGQMLLVPLLGFFAKTPVPAGGFDFWSVLSMLPILALVVVRRLPPEPRTSPPVLPRPLVAHESASR